LKRSLLSLLLLVGALAACGDKPPGQLEPIPRPAGYKDPPKAEGSKPAAEPAPDPNKVVLRWKLGAGAPMAFRLEGTPEDGASPLKAVYVLHHPEAGDNVVRIAMESSKGAPEQGTFSERGFILDGLGNVDRNLATLLLELPKEPVGVGDTWALGTDFVNPEPLGLGFNTKKSDRRNTVKLESLTPEGDDRVATLQYDLFETVSGAFPPGAQPASPAETSPLKAAPEKGKGKDKGKKAAADAPRDDKPRSNEVLTEVTFKGSGQFLVKAGRWRSWQGTLASKTEGYTPAPGKALAQVPPGTLKLQLTALNSVPAELQPEAKK
jgi:predicted small lipoprotein YifL